MNKIAGKFAVIDTETTWGDEVMSIGIVIANTETFALIDKKYYILTPYRDYGGMFYHALYANGVTADLEGSRESAMRHLTNFLSSHNITAIFAYNASFDHRHLPELHHLDWHDIMKLAAYRQHNHKIPAHSECFRTGRLKRGYGVESIYRMLSAEQGYHEIHNALTDAIDELEIMRLLSLQPGRYALARLKQR